MTRGHCSARCRREIIMVTDADSLETVRQLLVEYVPAIDVWAFGSRVHGSPKSL